VAVVVEMRQECRAEVVAQVAVELELEALELQPLEQLTQAVVAVELVKQYSVVQVELAVMVDQELSSLNT
jgi:hypothetical protein